MRLLKSVLIAAALVSAACGDEMPTDPTDRPASLTGTWRGTITVTNITATMTWTLTQTGSAVTGPAVIGLSSGAVLMNGTVSGTLSGSTLPFTLTVSPGGIPAQPACTGQIAGTNTVSGTSTMNGSYTVASSTCTTGLTSGTFTLTRQ
jgi:hypothetical protein